MTTMDEREAAELEDVMDCDASSIPEHIEAIKALDKVLDMLNQQRNEHVEAIKAEMKDATLAVHEGKPLVSWRWENRTLLDGRGLRAHDEALWRRFAKSSRVRRFLIR